MSFREPLLAVCDFVAWRLELLQSALVRAISSSSTGEFEITIGYRLRDGQ